MPYLSPPLLQSLAAGLPFELAPKIGAALRAQDKHNSDVALALKNAVVRGDTLQVFYPYTSASPLTVPSDVTLVGSFSNSWAALGGFQAPGYRVDAQGYVELVGGMTGGTLLSTAFVLPAPYRPAAQLQFAVACWTGSAGAAGGIRLDTSGNVVAAYGNNTQLFLDGVRFKPANPAPYVPSCFPFDVAWPKNYAPTVVLAQCLDANTANPSNLALALPDWTLVAKGMGQFIHVRNLPGLLPGKQYSVTLLAL